MITYKAYKPSAWDHHIFIDEEREGYLVAAFQSRDSSILEQSNFIAARELLKEESEVHRFNHWACGWIEILLAPPETEALVKGIEDRLENYPILDEMHYSEMQYNIIMDYWDNLSLSDKIGLCVDAGASIFAARGMSGEVFDKLSEEIW